MAKTDSNHFLNAYKYDFTSKIKYLVVVGRADCKKNVSRRQCIKKLTFKINEEKS